MGDAMSKCLYFIFLLPFTRAFAMDTAREAVEPLKAKAKQVVIVANILEQGVTAQIFSAKPYTQEEEKEKKIWVRSVSNGRISISPPTKITFHYASFGNTKYQ